MRFTIIASALAGGVLALAVAASGQEARKYEEVDTARVVSVDADAGRVIVADRGGAEKTFRVDEKTRILRGGDAISLSDVGANDRVVVNARSGLEGEEQTAEYIQVVSGGTPPVGSAPEDAPAP